MELSNLQGQLKVAIQKHQIIVAKMKNDEHNVLLQKQLRELQAEIISLGEKQKCVVENLRKERDLNPNKVQQPQQLTKTTKAITATTLSSLSTNTVNVIPSNARFIISTTENKTRQISVNTGAQSHGLSFRVEKPVIKSGSIVPPIPSAAQKIIHQVVPSIVSNLVVNASSNALKATVLFPSLSASQTSAIINASNRVVNPKTVGVTTTNSSSVSTAISNPSSSVLVVPSPISSCRPSSDSLTVSSSNPTIVQNSTCTTTTSSASFILKLGSPIRVPQYPPPNSRPTTVTSTVDSCGSCVVTAVENAPPVKKEKKIPQPLSLPANDTKTIDVKPIKLKTEKVEDSTKMNFMTALGLINREVMNELQSKRGERKRRTTANPQFSNAAIEEKKRNAAALLSAAATNPSLKIKKPRGRQKLNVSPIQSLTPTPPTTPSATSIATSIAITTTNSRIENGANIFISRNGTNLVITNTTTQCNSLDNLPVGVHHVRVKSEPSLSQSSCTIFGGNVSSSYDCVPLNCSKKFVTPSAVMAVNKNVLNHNKIANSSSFKTSADNGNILTTKVDSLIKPIPKNNILNGCLKTVLNKNGGILSDVILCGICHLRLGAGSGDMLACFSCKRPYHTRCAAKVVPQLNDGKIVNKNAHWKCPKCAICISASTISSPAASSSSITLTVPVKTSFTHHQPWKKDTQLPIPVRTEKQVKEEEKQRHLKRSKELNEEMARLKDKRQRLADVQAANLKRQAELAAAKKSTEAALNKMHETVNMVRNRIS